MPLQKVQAMRGIERKYLTSRKRKWKKERMVETMMYSMEKRMPQGRRCCCKCRLEEFKKEIINRHRRKRLNQK